MRNLLLVPSFLFVLLARLPVIQARDIPLDSKPFTPEDKLSCPDPKPAIASPDGSHAIEIVDQWNPEGRKVTRSLYLLSLNTTVTTPPVKLYSCSPGEMSDLLWLSDDTVAYLNDTSFYYFSATYTAEALTFMDKEIERTRLFDFPKETSPTGMKYNQASGILAWSGMVCEDGDFETVASCQEKYENRGDSGVVYDELFIRHDDHFRPPNKIWTLGATKLERTKRNDVEEVAVTAIKDRIFYNLLNASSMYSQVDPITTFSVSDTHIAFAIKAQHLNPAIHTRHDVYTLPLPHTTHVVVTPSLLTPEDHGLVAGVSFSPDGKKLAWLEMAVDQNEADRTVLMVTEHFEVVRSGTVKWTEHWDRSPSILAWSIDSESIFLVADHEGLTLPFHITHPGHLPEPLLFDHSTTSLTGLASGSLLLSVSSFRTPNDIFVLQTEQAEKDKHAHLYKVSRDPLHRITDWSRLHIAGRLDDIEIEKFWFEGAEGWRVMGWAFKPKGWKKTDSRAVWPMAFIVHGGPQMSWVDSFSHRSNGAVSAAQGYFTIAINPTGSTGYGQEFTSRIEGQWGGLPFKDLLAGYQYALNRWPEIDPQRTAMLGSSYGGFMANWIQGHNDQFGFKAIVSSDTMFDIRAFFYNTEELWFPLWNMGGSPAEIPDIYEKWNPVNFVSQWSTPQLTIQGGLDYRLVDSHGFSAFTALQVQGVPSRMLYFPDESHGTAKPSNTLRWNTEIYRWLEEWIGAGKRDRLEEQDEGFFIQ